MLSFSILMMGADFLHTLLLAGAFLLLFGSAELLYHRFKIQADITRKYVHILTGIFTMMFPPLLGNHWYVLALCGSFLVILLLSMRFKILPSINGIKRPSLGSLFYPVIVYGCFLAFQFREGNLIYYYIPILTLAFCDPIAELCGKTLGYGKYTIGIHTKTLAGSAAFFVSSFLLSMALFLSMTSQELMHLLPLCGVLALSMTIAEALAQKGYDNLTIPATGTLILFLFGV